MKEDQDLSTQAYGHTPMHEKLDLRMHQKKAQASIGRLVSVQAMQARRWNNQEHGYVKLPEQWRTVERA